MSDEADIANDRAMAEMELARQSINTKPEAESTGHCLECDQIIEAPKRWCDADCRDLWQERGR